MRQIDIDSLEEATLIELNARIVERLQLWDGRAGDSSLFGRDTLARSNWRSSRATSTGQMANIEREY